MSRKKIIDIEIQSLKELTKLPLEVLRISTEQIIRKLPKKELCSWLSFLPRAVSHKVLDQIVKESNNWEEIEKEDLDSFSGADHILDEMERPSLQLIKGGKDEGNRPFRGSKKGI